MYKFKSPQQSYSIKVFQNERFTLLEIPSRGEQFSLQDRSKRYLFLSTRVPKFLRACFQDIFKIIEGTNS